MKRTCPPPAAWPEIQVGDRIRYQHEGMLVEVEDTVAAHRCGMLVTEGGQELLPHHYILRLERRADRMPVPGNTAAPHPGHSRRPGSARTQPPGPAACCGLAPRFERRPRRAGYAERLACPACGRGTPWLYAGRNGEHRPDLLRHWQRAVAAEPSPVP